VRLPPGRYQLLLRDYECGAQPTVLPEVEVRARLTFGGHPFRISTLLLQPQSNSYARTSVRSESKLVHVSRSDIRLILTFLIRLCGLSGPEVALNRPIPFPM
jgi:hypothetical protein